MGGGYLATPFSLMYKNSFDFYQKIVYLMT